MLSPEVWYFKEPTAKFKEYTGYLNETACSNAINSIVCNHLVTAVVPDTLNVPEEFANALMNDCEYYKVESVPLSEFINKHFVESFVKKGELTGLSVNTRIDCDDCVLFTPEGVLVLSLIKDTYQRLGVEGKVSRFHGKTKGRYIVTIDLKHCKPGKYYNRIKERFSTITTNLLIKWQSEDNRICPSSIAKYFHQRGFIVKECSNASISRIEYSVKIPEIDFSLGEEFVEWLGMLSLNCDLNETSDDFINTYQTPKPNSMVGQVKILQWRGFFTAAEIKKLFEYIKKYVQEQEKLWIALYVQGFSDCPFSWRNYEQNYFTNGDNSYVIVLKENKYLLCKQTC